MLLAIALFKLVKCVALICLGVGAFRLLRDPDIEGTARYVLDQLGVDPDGRIANHVLAAVAHLTPSRLKELGVGTLLYAVVFAVEGTGLLMRKRWAEYLTAVITFSFIPFEIFELVKKPSFLKTLGIFVNALIVVYLVARLRRERASAKGSRHDHATGSLASVPGERG